MLLNLKVHAKHDYYDGSGVTIGVECIDIKKPLQSGQILEILLYVQIKSKTATCF